MSPPSFRRPEELTGDKRAVARLDGGHLPWEGNGEKARSHTRLYYQIVLGTVNLEAAVTRLMAVYGETRIERREARGEAILGVVIVDREGIARYVEYVPELGSEPDYDRAIAVAKALAS